MYDIAAKRGSRRVRLLVPVRSSGLVASPITGITAGTPFQLRPGCEGTVQYTSEVGTLHVLFDNGRQVGLIPGEDRWEQA